MTPSASPVAEKVTLLLVPMAEAGGETFSEMRLAVPLAVMTWGDMEALSAREMVSERAPE